MVCSSLLFQRGELLSRCVVCVWSPELVLAAVALEVTGWGHRGWGAFLLAGAVHCSSFAILCISIPSPSGVLPVIPKLDGRVWKLKTEGSRIEIQDIMKCIFVPARYGLDFSTQRTPLPWFTVPDFVVIVAYLHLAAAVEGELHLGLA